MNEPLTDTGKRINECFECIKVRISLNELAEFLEYLTEREALMPLPQTDTFNSDGFDVLGLVRRRVESLKNLLESEEKLLKEAFKRGGILSFQVGTRTLKFREPLMLEREKMEGGICLTHKGLSLSACGKSWGECSDIIREELALIWEKYVLAPDDELTADGIALKNKLLGMVEGVKPQK